MRTGELRRGWLTAAAAAAAVLAGLWLLASRSDPEPAAAVVATASTSGGAPAAPSATSAQVASDSAAIPADRPLDLPPGVSSEQWAALESEMKTRADGPAELARMRDYLAWADTLRLFREARQGGAAAGDMTALAQKLDDGLADRLRRAEVSAGEAQQIESAIVDLTVADESQRAVRLRQWASTELAPAGPADPRQAAFERAQGEIVTAWSALPPAARDPAVLERDLEALRQQTFATRTR